MCVYIYIYIYIYLYLYIEREREGEREGEREREREMHVLLNCSRGIAQRPTEDESIKCIVYICMYTHIYI